jgi:iron complex transport system substrate-binding protein
MMVRPLAIFAVLSATLLSAAGPPAFAQAPGFSVVDDAGRTVVLAGTPQRIVSIAPGATEMLFAAGAGDRVIATVSYSDEPEAAKAVPRVGDNSAIDMERVVALRPDVVVVWEGGSNPAQVSQLERLNVPLYRHKVEKLADIPVALRRLGTLTRTADVANKAAADVEARLAKLRQLYGKTSNPTVLLQVWNRPIYTVGGSHMMTDSLRLCGARNVFADLKEQGPSVDMEAVIGRDPAIIVAVAPPGTADGWLNDWRRFGTMTAVKTGRLVAFEDVRLSRLGPSAVGGTEALCNAINRPKP